jgi:hypothetical protein
MTTPISSRDTDVQAFIAELDGGVFLEKLARALSEVAGGVMDNHAVGRVKLDFSIKRLGSSHQVNVSHKLEYTIPQMRGKVTEDDITDTPMYVGTGGKMTFFPENQADFFGLKGQVNASSTDKETKE